MGVGYWIIPVVREAARLRTAADSDLAWLSNVIGTGGLGEWFARQLPNLEQWLAHLAPDLDPAAGRFPTPLEVREILSGLAGLRFHIAQYVPPAGDPGWWSARVKTYLDADERSLIKFGSYNGSESVPPAMYFEKGSFGLNLFLADELARICGPLLFWPDTEQAPTHLLPGYDAPVYRAVPAPGEGRLVRWTPERVVLGKTFSPLVPFPDPEHEGLLRYLDALAIPHPPPTLRGRLPTYAELTATLESMQPWAQIGEQHEGDYVRRTLYVGDPGARRPVARVLYPDWGFEEQPDPADPSEPVPVHFEAGELRVEVTIIERLARHCGPQVLLLPHGSRVPLVVQAADDPDRLLARWERFDAEFRQDG